MKRLAFLCLSLMLVFACARLTASAQGNVCTAKLAQLPQASELKGFQLGMTMEQVKARVPHIVFGRVDKFGVVKTSINPDFNPKLDKASFEGVRTVSLDFLDGRLTSLWLGYDESFKWQTPEEFTRGIGAALKLPDAWRSRARGGFQMSCADFQLTVTTVARTPSLHISDELAQQTLTKRMEETEDTEEETADETASSSQTPNESEKHADPEVVPIIGDKHSKSYYRRDCAGYNSVPEKDRAIFSSTEQAAKAGYKPSKTCP